MLYDLELGHKVAEATLPSRLVAIEYIDCFSADE